MKFRITNLLLLLLLHHQLAVAQEPKAGLLLFNVSIINVTDGSVKRNTAIAMEKQSQVRWNAKSGNRHKACAW